MISFHLISVSTNQPTKKNKNFSMYKKPCKHLFSRWVISNKDNLPCFIHLSQQTFAKMILWSCNNVVQGFRLHDLPKWDCLPLISLPCSNDVILLESCWEYDLKLTFHCTSLRRNWDIPFSEHFVFSFRDLNLCGTAQSNDVHIACRDWFGQIFC